MEAIVLSIGLAVGYFCGKADRFNNRLAERAEEKEWADDYFDKAYGYFKEAIEEYDARVGTRR